MTRIFEEEIKRKGNKEATLSEEITKGTPSYPQTASFLQWSVNAAQSSQMKVVGKDAGGGTVDIGSN